MPIHIPPIQNAEYYEEQLKKADQKNISLIIDLYLQLIVVYLYTETNQENEKKLIQAKLQNVYQAVLTFVKKLATNSAAALSATSISAASASSSSYSELTEDLSRVAAVLADKKMLEEAIGLYQAAIDLSGKPNLEQTFKFYLKQTQIMLESKEFHDCQNLAKCLELIETTGVLQKIKLMSKNEKFSLIKNIKAIAAFYKSDHGGSSEYMADHMTTEQRNVGTSIANMVRLHGGETEPNRSYAIRLYHYALECVDYKNTTDENLALIAELYLEMIIAAVVRQDVVYQKPPYKVIPQSIQKLIINASLHLKNVNLPEDSKIIALKAIRQCFNENYTHPALGALINTIMQASLFKDKETNFYLHLYLLGCYINDPAKTTQTRAISLQLIPHFKELIEHKKKTSAVGVKSASSSASSSSASSSLAASSSMDTKESLESNEIVLRNGTNKDANPNKVISIGSLFEDILNTLFNKGLIDESLALSELTIQFCDPNDIQSFDPNEPPSLSLTKIRHLTRCLASSRFSNQNIEELCGAIATLKRRPIFGTDIVDYFINNIITGQVFKNPNDVATTEQPCRILQVFIDNDVATAELFFQIYKYKGNFNYDPLMKLLEFTFILLHQKFSIDAVNKLITTLDQFFQPKSYEEIGRGHTRRFAEIADHVNHRLLQIAYVLGNKGLFSQALGFCEAVSRLETAFGTRENLMNNYQTKMAIYQQIQPLPLEKMMFAIFQFITGSGTELTADINTSVTQNINNILKIAEENDNKILYYQLLSNFLLNLLERLRPPFSMYTGEIFRPAEFPIFKHYLLQLLAHDQHNLFFKQYNLGFCNELSQIFTNLSYGLLQKPDETLKLFSDSIHKLLTHASNLASPSMIYLATEIKLQNILLKIKRKENADILQVIQEIEHANQYKEKEASEDTKALAEQQQNKIRIRKVLLAIAETVKDENENLRILMLADHYIDTPNERTRIPQLFNLIKAGCKAGSNVEESINELIDMLSKKNRHSYYINDLLALSILLDNRNQRLPAKKLAAFAFHLVDYIHSAKAPEIVDNDYHSYSDHSYSAWGQTFDTQLAKMIAVIKNNNCWHLLHGSLPKIIRHDITILKEVAAVKQIGIIKHTIILRTLCNHKEKPTSNPIESAIEEVLSRSVSLKRDNKAGKSLAKIGQQLQSNINWVATNIASAKSALGLFRSSVTKNVLSRSSSSSLDTFNTSKVLNVREFGLDNNIRRKLAIDALIEMDNDLRFVPEASLNELIQIKISEINLTATSAILEKNEFPDSLKNTVSVAFRLYRLNLNNASSTNRRRSTRISIDPKDAAEITHLKNLSRALTIKLHDILKGEAPNKILRTLLYQQMFVWAKQNVNLENNLNALDGLCAIAKKIESHLQDLLVHVKTQGLPPLDTSKYNLVQKLGAELILHLFEMSPLQLYENLLQLFSIQSAERNHLLLQPNAKFETLLTSFEFCLLTRIESELKKSAESSNNTAIVSANASSVSASSVSTTTASISSSLLSSNAAISGASSASASSSSISIQTKEKDEGQKLKYQLLTPGLGENVRFYLASLSSSIPSRSIYISANTIGSWIMEAISTLKNIKSSKALLFSSISAIENISVASSSSSYSSFAENNNSNATKTKASHKRKVDSTNIATTGTDTTTTATAATSASASSSISGTTNSAAAITSNNITASNTEQLKKKRKSQK